MIILSELPSICIQLCLKKEHKYLYITYNHLYVYTCKNYIFNHSDYYDKNAIKLHPLCPYMHVWNVSLCVCVCVCVYIYIYIWKVKVKPLSCVWFFATPWTVDDQGPPSMGFSRQEYWSGLPFPSPGIFPTQGLNPCLLHCRQTLYRLSHQGSIHIHIYV